MAFCPECGKSATAEASKCVHCGFELGLKGKPEKARFKGTMMMSAPTPGAPAAEASTTASAAAGAQAGSVVPKPGLKATMVGGAITAPAALGSDEAKKKMAFAATQPLASATSEAKNEVVAASQAVLDAPAPAGKKYLPGDPMAPSPVAAVARPRSQSRQIAQLEERAEKNPMFLVWLALGGMVVIGAVGYAAASYMGLV